MLLNIHLQLMKPGLSGSPFPGPPAGEWLSSPLCSAVSRQCLACRGPASWVTTKVGHG